MMKKAMGILLVLLVVASVAYASGTSQAGQTVGGLQADGAPIREYPISAAAPVTLSFWMPLHVAAARFISSYKDNPALVKMEENTGVTIEWLHAAAGQEQEQFNLLIASGDLPDLLGAATYYQGGEFKGMYDGAFLELTEYIPRYAPDYFQLIREDEEFFREVSDADGRVTGFYAYKPSGDPPFRRFILRQDVLDDLNQEIPQTVADWERLFEAMKGAGMTPYAMEPNGHEEQFIGMFGIYAKPNEFYQDQSGTIRFGQIEPEFRQYLELMNSWYRKGYISSDFMSLTGLQRNTLFDTKQIGTMIGAIVANFNRGMTMGIPVTAAPYPRINLGDQLHYEFTDIWPRMQFPTSMAVISSKTEFPDVAMRFLNYGYTEEGFELLNWGVEGLNWDWVDGKRVYNDLMLENPRFGTEEASNIYKIHFFPKLTGLDTVVHANLLRSPASLASRQQWADDPNIDSMHKLPPFQLPSDDLTRRTRIMTDINTYVSEMVLKFIIGTEPLSGFDAFVRTIEDMGIAEAISLTQRAFDSYMEKEFPW